MDNEKKLSFEVTKDGYKVVVNRLCNYKLKDLLEEYDNYILMLTRPRKMYGLVPIETEADIRRNIYSIREDDLTEPRNMMYALTHRIDDVKYSTPLYFSSEDQRVITQDVDGYTFLGTLALYSEDETLTREEILTETSHMRRRIEKTMFGHIYEISIYDTRSKLPDESISTKSYYGEYTEDDAYALIERFKRKFKLNFLSH